MPTEVPALDTPPTAPSRASPSTFAPRSDAWVSWFEDWAPDFGNAAVATAANAQESLAHATSALAAANSVGAALWVSGTTYAIGDVRRSPANGYPYRRLTAGAGTTDPSADATSWVLAALYYPSMLVVTGSSATASPWWHYVLTSASLTTLTLPASPAAGDVVWVTVANDRADNVVNRNGNRIMTLLENMTLNVRQGTVMLRYVNSTKGWTIV